MFQGDWHEVHIGSILEARRLRFAQRDVMIASSLELRPHSLKGMVQIAFQSLIKWPEEKVKANNAK